MTDVRRATKSDRATAADTLGATFVTDPFVSWIMRSGAGESQLRAFFAAELRGIMRDPEHLVLVADDGAAVAVWRGVDKWKSGLAETLHIVAPVLRTFRIRHGISALRKIEDVHPHDPHYYLDSVATRPDRQGEGLGMSLLATMLQRADNEGLPCYLESSNPVNEPFYGGLGFTIRDEVEITPGAPILRTMWREPREPDQS